MADVAIGAKDEKPFRSWFPAPLPGLPEANQAGVIKLTIHERQAQPGEQRDGGEHKRASPKGHARERLPAENHGQQQQA